MPGMSGIELAERLKDRLGEAKVIYMSGYSGDVVFDKSRLNPSAAFLEKPFGPAKLLSVVRELLDRPLAETLPATPDRCSETS